MRFTYGKKFYQGGENICQNYVPRLFLPHKCIRSLNRGCFEIDILINIKHLIYRW